MRHLKYLSLAIIVLFLVGCTSAVQTSQEPAPAQQPSTVTHGEVKEIDMTAKKWEFNPDRIDVKKGDTVRLKIRSLDVTHGFALPQFNVDERLIEGKETIIEFTADKEGTFDFYCSVFCGEGHGSMRGTLVVSP